tara:strand:+ start:722 stop:958 length:237 start_codon:yes stop_codon:yes gene_type:complete
MFNLKLEAVSMNTATYGMDGDMQYALEGEEMNAIHSGNGHYPLWDRLEAAIVARYPNAMVAGTEVDGHLKVIVMSASY